MKNKYLHTVQYYETDKMGITHHSNYIRWMEEARVAFLAGIGWDFTKIEALGIVSPVISLSCEYRKPTVFSEIVMIRVWVEEFKGVRLKLAYEMKNMADEVVCLATSSHAFLDQNGRPVRIKQEYPEFYKALTESDEGV